MNIIQKHFPGYEDINIQKKIRKVYVVVIIFCLSIIGLTLFPHTMPNLITELTDLIPGSGTVNKKKFGQVIIYKGYRKVATYNHGFGKEREPVSVDMELVKRLKRLK